MRALAQQLLQPAERMMDPACPHHDQTASRRLLGKAWTAPISHTNAFSCEQKDVLVYRALLTPFSARRLVQCWGAKLSAFELQGRK